MTWCLLQVYNVNAGYSCCCWRWGGLSMTWKPCSPFLLRSSKRLHWCDSVLPNHTILRPLLYCPLLLPSPSSILNFSHRSWPEKFWLADDLYVSTAFILWTPRVGLRGGGTQGTYGTYPRSSILFELNEVIIQECSLKLSSKELPSLLFHHKFGSL